MSSEISKTQYLKNHWKFLVQGTASGSALFRCANEIDGALDVLVSKAADNALALIDLAGTIYKSPKSLLGKITLRFIAVIIGLIGFLVAAGFALAKLANFLAVKIGFKYLLVGTIAAVVGGIEYLIMKYAINPKQNYYKPKDDIDSPVIRGAKDYREFVDKMLKPKEYSAKEYSAKAPATEIKTEALGRKFLNHIIPVANGLAIFSPQVLS